MRSMLCELRDEIENHESCDVFTSLEYKSPQYTLYIFVSDSFLAMPGNDKTMNAKAFALRSVCYMHAMRMSARAFAFAFRIRNRHDSSQYFRKTLWLGDNVQLLDRTRVPIDHLIFWQQKLSSMFFFCHAYLSGIRTQNVVLFFSNLYSHDDKHTYTHPYRCIQYFSTFFFVPCIVYNHFGVGYARHVWGLEQWH